MTDSRVELGVTAIAHESGLPEDREARGECASQQRAAQLGTMIQSWMEDGAEEQRETIEHLVRALDEDRLSNRKLFPRKLKGKSW